MRAKIAVDLGCPPDRVSVKATRAAALPFAQQVDDIAAITTVLIDDVGPAQN